jgi:hypothetical protein
VTIASEHARITIMPLWRDLSLGHGSRNGATWLVGVRAVIEITLTEKWAKLAETPGQFVRWYLP